jgi:dTDP-4-dehydrorhamnose reductase
MKQLVLVLGAGGQLGESMAVGLGATHAVIARTRADLDVTNTAAVERQIAALCPDAIVNCSAYTNVDGAEADPLAALATNAWAVRGIARAAARIDATFVHFSTDFVFDGDATRPYTEADAPNPRGTYAMSKLLGEWLAADVERHYVLRVESLFGGRLARSSVDVMATGIDAGGPVRAFADRTVSPSFVEDVVTATRSILANRPPVGVYHCVNSGFGTWLDVAHTIRQLRGRPDARVDAIRMAEARLKAPRPLFAALDNRKLTDAGIVMPDWQDAIARYLSTRMPAPAR